MRRPTRGAPTGHPIASGIDPTAAGTTTTTTGPPPVIAFCNRHYAALAAAVLGLAAFNLAFRLGSEIVTQWDESLYAIAAWEMVDSGNWIGTTFLGTLDYYNAKPPLNVWLIALAFKAFGKSLVSLRLVPVVSAWLTVAVLQGWTRRSFGPPVALLAGLVLATTFGFLYVHAGRSANTDALFTLLILLMVVTLWAARDRPWQSVWLGPLAAAAFLLRGMAVLMPLAIVLAVEVSSRRRQPKRWIAILTAVLLFLVPVMAWAVARWQVDEWRFFERLFGYDFVARSVRVLERHPGGPLYYLNILQKHQYDWLLAGLVAWILFPVPWPRLRNLLWFWRGDDGLKVLLASWAGITLLIPTLMRTKLPWYLNPFYPVFALGIAWILAHGFSAAANAGSVRRRLAILGFVVVLALAVAEGKLIWYSFHHRDLRQSVQGLLLTEGDRLAGRRVFRNHWDRAEMFIIGGVLGAERRLAAGLEDFWRDSRPGDYLVLSQAREHPDLVLVRSGGRHWLYRRRE